MYDAMNILWSRNDGFNIFQFINITYWLCNIDHIYIYIYMTYNMYWGYDLFKHHLILKVSFLDFEVFEY